MQNEVFNRKLFQRKGGARAKLNQMAGADMPSGILASSQPLIDEAMKSVRQPETSAIPMDIAKGMSAGRADGMPMAPAPMPMPMQQPMAPAPMPMAPPPQQMAQAPVPPPSLNPMRPGVKTMQEGGEPIPMGPMESGAAAIDRNMTDIDISNLAGTVLQAIGLIDDPDVKPKPTLQGLVAIAGGDPDARNIKGAADEMAGRLNLSKINTKDSIPKIVKQIRGDLGKMAESEAFFGMAADKDPRAASAFGRAMGKAQGTQMALEADAQKTALANAETERLLRLKAELTPATAGSSLYRKSMRPTEARGRAYQLAMEATRDMYFTLPEGFTTAEEYAQQAGKTAYEMALVNGDDGGGGGGGGGGVGGFANTPEGLLAQAQDAIKDDPSKKDAIVNELKRRGVSTEGIA